MDATNGIDLSSNRKCATVSYIKSPTSFWVRLEEFKVEYINMVKELQVAYENANIESDLNAQSITVGSIYCVFNQKQFEWQRCEIIRINQNDLSIFYVDSGVADLVSIKSVKTLKEQFKAIHRFALHCSLENLKPTDSNIWKQSIISHFSENVLFKLVTLNFKSKSENVYNVDMYLKSQNISELLVSSGFAFYQNQMINEGEKIQKEIFTSRLIKPVNIPLCDYDNFQLEVTCIYSPFCFYAQLSLNLEEFSLFEEQLQEYYENRSENILLKKPQIGQMCIARYSVDDAWYRATIKEIDLDLNSVVVFFIDYGNQETIQIDGNLLVINEQFVKYPCMAILCCLDGISPIIDTNRPESNSEECINFMYDSMSFKVMAKFVGKFSNDCYLVSVQVEEKNGDMSRMLDLADLLIQKNHVKSCEKSRCSQLEKKKLIKGPIKQITQHKPITEALTHTPQFKKYMSNELSLTEKNKYEFLITHIETICEFYVQIEVNKAEFRSLVADMQYFYEKKPNLPAPLYQLHNACVYYDDEKKLWHRAQIFNIIDENNCVIYLIDIGQKKCVNKTQLRDIYEKYLNITAQAAQASLDDLKNHKAEEVDELLQNKFKDIALGKNFFGKVVDAVENTAQFAVTKKKYLLNLFDSHCDSVYSVLMQDINNSLVSESFKPNIKSKLEETSVDIQISNDETLNESLSLINRVGIVQPTNSSNNRPPKNFNNYQNNYNHDYRQPCIHDDVTSPFPKHDIELTAKQSVYTQHVSKAYDQTDFVRPVSKTSLTLIETADKLKHFKNQSELQPEASAVKGFLFSETQDEIIPTKSYSVSVSNFESAQNFSVQFTDLFVEFDEHFEEFQQSCADSPSIKIESLHSFTKNLNKLAIAAKFYEDTLWYRARIVNSEKLHKENLCLVEFVDYGNRQLTSLKDCVFLNEKFSKLKPSAVNLSGLAYVNLNSKLTEIILENLLSFNNIQIPNDAIIKHEWKSVYFVKKENDNSLYIEIDELYTHLYKSNLIDTNFTFKPIEYSEPIVKQANESEIITKLPCDGAYFDGIVTDMSGGLQFIYIILKQSIPKLLSLEKELESQPLNMLFKITDLDNLVVNNFYLVKYNNKLSRCILLTPSCKKSSFYLLQQIDYGKKIVFDSRQQMESTAEFFVMPIKYYKQNSFVIHCQLPYAFNIEKVWLKEEKEKFFRSIQLQKEYRIRLFSTKEPYLIEFKEDAQKIDFQFNSIVLRINQNELEPQTILNGNCSVSLSEQFYFGGEWLRKNDSENNEMNLFFEQENIKRDGATFYIYSKTLLNRFQLHYNFIIDKSLKLICLDSVRKGDMILFRRKSKAFLESLNDEIRPLIENYLSRVRVKSISTCKTTGNKTYSLFYCDFGFTDFLQVSSSQTITSNRIPTTVDYEVYAMTVQSKILPLFTFECSLDKSYMLDALLKAKQKNDFVDAFYLNSVITRMFKWLSSVQLKVNFTQPLCEKFQANALPSNIFTVDLFDSSDMQPIVGKIIDYGLKDIVNHSFLCVITHFNHLNNFYVQKFDEGNTVLLDKLQETIQLKVATNKLLPVTVPVLDKLCIALYTDDQQYYRAKVIKFVNSKQMQVFFIDFGNTSLVELSQIREITPDLVDSYPRAFSIDCELDVKQNGLNPSELEELNLFFQDIAVEEFKFDVKFVSRKDNKYSDTSSYIIEMYEAERKQSIFEIFRKHKEAQGPETSNVNLRFSESTNISSEDDQAMAETLNNSSGMSKLIDQTNNDNTMASISKSFIPNHLDPSWQEPSSKPKKAAAGLDETSSSTLSNFSKVASIRNENSSWNETAENLKFYDNRNDTTITSQTAAEENSWNLTSASLKNYVTNNCRTERTFASENSLLIVSKQNIEIDILGTSNQANNSNETDLDADDVDDKNELYDTANESSVVFKPSNLSKDDEHTLTDTVCEMDQMNRTNEDFNDIKGLLIKKCIVSFMSSSISFYLQSTDFEEKLAEIQPEIEDCLEPFDASVSTLCIGQWSADHTYYRMRLIDWPRDSDKALCLFIDFGNLEYIVKDSITAMSEKLKKVKPLAIHCRLYTSIDNKPNCFHNLEDLVNSEMVFDAVIESKEKLTEFYDLQMNEKSQSETEAINCRLYLLNKRKIEINEMTLGQDEWPTLLQYIKAEPLSILINEDPNETKTATQKNCLDYSSKQNMNNKNRKDDDDDDHDESGKRKNCYLSHNSNSNFSHNQSNYNSTTGQQNNRESNSNKIYSNHKQHVNILLPEEADQQAIDKFVQDEENKSCCLESNKPEVFMYMRKEKNDDLDCSESASVITDYSINNTTMGSDRNFTVNDFHDQDSIWSKKDEESINTTNISCKNLTVSRLNESEWSVSNETINKTLDAKNLTVSRFNDQESVWSTNQNDETVNNVYFKKTICLDTSKEENNKSLSESIDYIARTIDERDHSVWTTTNDSTLNNSVNNKTVDEFHDQESVWSVNQSATTCNSSVNVPNNRTVDGFHDQDSNWTVNQCDKTIINNSLNNPQNKTIAEFHDQDTIWSANQSNLSGFNELNDEENKNITIAKFHDHNSIWSGKDDYENNAKNKNLAIPFTKGTTNPEKSSNESSFLPKSINENNNQFVSQSDIHQKIANRKLYTDEGTIDDVNEKVNYMHQIDGFVMRVNSLNDFYLQIEDADMNLMNMKTDLEKCRKPFDKMPQLGTICVAPYHIDKQFYRAQIIEIEKSNANFSLNINPNSSFNTSVNKFNEPKVRVHYIDYGNEDVVDLNEIFKITLELKNMAPLALNCRLNLSKKLKDWIKNKADLKQDVTHDLHKCFKNITSKSKIKLKVIKEIGENLHIKSPALLVDAFLGDENICDSLLVSTLISHQCNSYMSEKKASENQEKNFEGYLIEIEPLNKIPLNSSYEIRIQNQSILKLIDELFQSLRNLSDYCSSRHNLEKGNLIGLFGFAPLPKILVERYQLKAGYSRVAIMESIKKLNEAKVPVTHVLVNYMDFGFKFWMELSELMMINDYLKEIRPSVEKFHLNISNISDLTSLNCLQLEHLNQIVKTLISYNEIEIKNFDSYHDSKRNFGCSSMFKTLVLSKNSNAFSNQSSTYDLKGSSSTESVRLYDLGRDSLDINRIIEICISVMTKPFVGHITHIESDFSQFECLNSASCPNNLEELQKLYRSTGYFSESTEKVNTDYQVGRLCLVNENTEQQLKESNLNGRCNSSESILSLNGYSNDNQDEMPYENQKMSTFKKGFFRGIIIDESIEKCVVLNVDNGKKMTLSKKRIQIMDDTEDSSNNSRLLVKLIPFMLIRARPKIQINDSNLKRILSNSRFYLETIKLNIIGSWISSVNRSKQQVNSISNTFIQNESNLNKITEIILENSPAVLKCQLNEQKSSENKISSISIDSSSFKRKRGDELGEQPENKVDQTTKAISKHKSGFTLSHVKSVGCFYLHSSESLKTIEFIEEQIQMEHQENNELRKMNKKEIKLDSVYGFYSDKEKKYYRVLLKNRSVLSPSNKTQIYQNQSSSSSIYNAFYLDYGFSGQINSKDLICVSDYVQQFAPQAVCCKLNGFSSFTKSNFADADSSETQNDTNEINSLSNYEVNCIDDEFKLETEAFLKFLSKKTFLATVYKRFIFLKKIENIVPLQTDNYLKPIEIVIHLYENPFTDDLNVTGLESFNVTYLIKQTLSQKSSKNIKQRKMCLFSLEKHMNAEQETMVELANVISPNCFYMCLTESNVKLKEMSKKMEKDYTNQIVPEVELKKGSYCAYIDKSKSIYKRARICEISISKKSAKLYLIDSGEYITDVNLNTLFKLFDLYYDLEPLCFECTLGLEYSKDSEVKYSNKIKSIMQLNKFFKLKLIKQLAHPTEEYKIYHVDLYGLRADLKETDHSYTMNISEQLKANSPLILLSSSPPPPSKAFSALPQSLTTTAASSNDLKLNLPFKEADVPLGQYLKIQLTNVDTVKHFGIVLISELEDRHKFLSSFHAWHKENKKNLKLVFPTFKSENNENSYNDKKQTTVSSGNKSSASVFVGLPCAISSIQIGKWCRGLISSVDFSSQMANVYLVDYCKTAQVAFDRIFKLDKKEYFEEPIYAHRCQLVDDVQQRAKFEKYLELLKGSIHPAKEIASSFNSEQNSLNSSHIAMENIEIQVVCMSKTCSVFNQMTSLQNYQYTINVVDFKRLRTSFPVSPFSNISNTCKTNGRMRLNSLQSLGLSPLTTNNLSSTSSTRKQRALSDDSATENILSTNFRNEQSFTHKVTLCGVEHNSISTNNAVFSFNANHLNTKSENRVAVPNGEYEQNSIMSYISDNSFNNLSVVTESTRITPSQHDENNTDDDITVQTDQTVVSIQVNTKNKHFNNKRMDKREDTSNWVKECDNMDEPYLKVHDTGLGSHRYRVRIILHSFDPSDFICQKLELLKAYEHLQALMNEFYEKQQSSELCQPSVNNVFVDSLESEKSSFINGYHCFNAGDFCAAQFGKSWNRCKIVDIEANKIALIECVDDCRTQRVHLSKLEKLNDEFRRLENLAMKCRLASLDTVNLFTINQKTIEKFKEIIGKNKHELIVEVVMRREENNDVNLLINDQDVLDFLNDLFKELSKSENF